MILFSAELELDNKNIMSKLIVDAAKNKIFLMIILKDNSYNISYENSRINYEKLTLLINEFLNSKNMDLKNISKIYVNRGPGSFAGIRNSLSVIKAIHLANKIDYFCFSFDDFNGENDIKYEQIPKLCEKIRVKKNLIKPIYMS